MAAGAAALFLANPLVGAAVGAGTLLAQKLMNNPIEQLFSYEYAVSGSWDDPVVQRAGRGLTAAAPQGNRAAEAAGATQGSAGAPLAAPAPGATPPTGAAPSPSATTSQSVPQ